MASPAATLPPVVDPVGGFTKEAFTRHLASQSGAPDWWIERKRSAYARFEALPMPTRTDEGWRFSTISGVNLAGFGPQRKRLPPGRRRRSPSPSRRPRSPSPMAGPRDPLPFPPSLGAKGVVVSTLSEALARHPGLMREHFMAQPQKLGSAKFAALHEAFVRDGAFIFVPKGVEVLTSPSSSSTRSRARAARSSRIPSSSPRTMRA